MQSSLYVSRHSSSTSYLSYQLELLDRVQLKTVDLLQTLADADFLLDYLGRM
jgi:hypothetical protein